MIQAFDYHDSPGEYSYCEKDEYVSGKMTLLIQLLLLTAFITAVIWFGLPLVFAYERWGR